MMGGVPVVPLLDALRMMGFSMPATPEMVR